MKRKAMLSGNQKLLYRSDSGQRLDLKTYIIKAASFRRFMFFCMQTYCGGGKVRVRGDLVGGHWHQKEEDHLFGEIIIPGARGARDVGP